MCDIVESVNKISSFIKVNPGKISYNNEKIICRTIPKTNQTISGFTTILESLARESKEQSVKDVIADRETQCLVSQWVDYAVLFVSPAAKDKHVTSSLLKELNSYLETRSYLVKHQLTMADLAVFFAIQEAMSNLSPLDKECYLNVSRWYDHLQQNKAIRQGGNLINFSTIHLSSWATGTHV